MISLGAVFGRIDKAFRIVKRIASFDWGQKFMFLEDIKEYEVIDFGELLENLGHWDALDFIGGFYAEFPDSYAIPTNSSYDEEGDEVHGSMELFFFDLVEKGILIRNDEGRWSYRWSDNPVEAYHAAIAYGVENGLNIRPEEEE